MANQRTIAAALGLTQSTVARALKGSPLVRPETRQRVEEAARAFGYHPNPLVSALMERIRSGREANDQGSIAILTSVYYKDGWPKGDEAHELQYNGLVHRATRRGFLAEKFYIGEEARSDEALDRILYTRGFSGVILGPQNRASRAALNFRFERYALASISSNWSSLSVDRASADHVTNVSLAFGEVVNRGYERIGLALPLVALQPGKNRWLASYLEHQYCQPKSSRIPVFEGSIHSCPTSKFRVWFDRWKPEVLLCLTGEELQWMNEMGLSPLEDLGLVCLNRPAASRFSGVEENNFHVGELTCEIVINHIIHNEPGLSAQPQIIRVQGKWVDGETLAARNPKGRRPAR